MYGSIQYQTTIIAGFVMVESCSRLVVKNIICSSLK